MSSIVNHANRFDVDVAHAKWAFFRSRKIIAASMGRRRAIWLCKRLPLLLTLLVSATLRALLSGAIWLLHYTSLVFVRSPWLSERLHVLAAHVPRLRLAKLAALGPALALAAITLITVGVVTAKPVTPVELVLPILPDTKAPPTLTASAREQVLRERTRTSGPSSSVTPGFARVSLLSEVIPEPLPTFGEDIAGMMLLMTPLPSPKAASRSSDLESTEVTEARSLPPKGTPSTSSRATAVAAAPVDVAKAAPAVLRPVAEEPEATSESLQPQQTSQTQGGERRDFVPHALW